MSTKAERTTAYIIETVAPVFNRHGYVGTSMSDLTEATNLTKGALYGNFENKEALALSAFDYNRKLLLNAIDEELSIEGTAMDRIHSLINFYNKLLAAATKETIKEIEGKIALVFENGVNSGEFKIPVSPLQFAKQLYTILQGSIAMATLTKDRKYLLNTVTYLEVLIKRELK